MPSGTDVPTRRKVTDPIMFKSLFTKLAPASTVAEPAETEESIETRTPRGYTVGWLTQTERTSVIWDAPKPFRQDSAKNPISKSVAQCPAVLDFDRRYFVVASPIDLHLRLSVTNGELSITNLLVDKSQIRPEALSQMDAFQTQHG